MLNPIPRDTSRTTPPAVDALVLVEPPRARATEPTPDAGGATHAGMAFVSAALFLVSGVALQESAFAGRPGYAFLGGSALLVALVLPVIDRFRRRG